MFDDILLLVIKVLKFFDLVIFYIICVWLVLFEGMVFVYNIIVVCNGLLLVMLWVNFVVICGLVVDI